MRYWHCGLAEKGPFLTWALPVARYPPHQLLPDQGGISFSSCPPTLSHPSPESGHQCSAAAVGLPGTQSAFLSIPCRIWVVGAARRGYKAHLAAPEWEGPSSGAEWAWVFSA